MKRILKSMLYGTAILAIAINTTACDDNTIGKITVDGKTYTISIADMVDEGATCIITLHTEKELIKKFEEFNNSPFWLGIINDGEYYSANAKAPIDDGIQFQVGLSGRRDRIVIFTPNQESIVEFDGNTKQVLPNPSAEDIKNLITHRNPELCKRFDSYKPLTPLQNKAGVSFQIISGQARSNTFGMIEYSNAGIKSRQDYTNEFTRHFFAVDADDPTRSFDVHLRSGRNFDNTEFFGVVAFPSDVDAKYVLIGFEGTGKGVPAEFETPSFFYIVELGDKYTEGDNTYTVIKSFCNTPYLAGDIFKNTKIE